MGTSRVGIEQQYLSVLKEILEKGITKHPERKLEAGRKLSHSTLGISHVTLTHYMEDGFPLFTTRKLPLKSTAVELEGFIKGITDKQWYQDRSCKYWDDWANPQLVSQAGFEATKSGEYFIQDKAKKQIKDLGPIYGYQWRQFGEHYTYDDGPTDYGYRVGYDWPVNGVEKGVDQLQNIVDTLKNNPNDRRMVCSAWNPNQFYLMALPPCHLMFGVDVWGDELNLWFIMRSCDFYLGYSANISSYALLLLLLAKESGFKPGKLTSFIADCHLYSNQLNNVEELLKREPFALPRVEITGDKSIFDWTYKDFALYNYVHHPALEKVEVVV